jgi:hypothetical protein
MFDITRNIEGQAFTCGCVHEKNSKVENRFFKMNAPMDVPAAGMPFEKAAFGCGRLKRLVRACSAVGRLF